MNEHITGMIRVILSIITHYCIHIISIAPTHGNEIGKLEGDLCMKKSSDNISINKEYTRRISFVTLSFIGSIIYNILYHDSSLEWYRILFFVATDAKNQLNQHF